MATMVSLLTGLLYVTPNGKLQKVKTHEICLSQIRQNISAKISTYTVFN